MPAALAASHLVGNLGMLSAHILGQAVIGPNLRAGRAVAACAREASGSRTPLLTSQFFKPLKRSLASQYAALLKTRYRNFWSGC